MIIAILGWGSLLWDKHPEFSELHEDWKFDGPSLKIEFSRVSQTRNDALTLVLDSKHGVSCQVAYTFSKRNNPDDVIRDVQRRERTSLKTIGFCFADNSRVQARDKEALKTIRNWSSEKKIDVVIWTDLESNFQANSKCKRPFSVEAALCHIQSLDSDGKTKAAEYVRSAPTFVKTPLRMALESQPWFQDHG